MKVKEVVVTENKVVVKSTDRVVGITRNKKGNNVLHFKAPTSKVGKEQGVKHFLSEDELIKHSMLGLSDEAVLDLAFALNQYVQEVLGVVVIEN
jgi:hypothetical protein